MGRKERFSASDKMNAIEDYLTGKRGRNQICLDKCQAAIIKS